MKAKFFTAGECRVDALTLTMFGEQQHERVAKELDWENRDRKETRVRYYVGEIVDEGDLGEVSITYAQQRGRGHMMLVAKSEISHPTLFALSPLEASCTRLDLQLTLPRESTGRVSRKICDALRDGDWPRKKRGVDMWDGDENKGSTIMVGSRQSMRYIRIYEKLGTDGKWYVRFEVEMKADLAQDAYHKLMHGGRGLIAPILLAEMDMLPKVDMVTDFLALRKRLQKEVWSHVNQWLGSQRQSENGSG